MNIKEKLKQAEKQSLAEISKRQTLKNQNDNGFMKWEGHKVS